MCQHPVIQLQVDQERVAFEGQAIKAQLSQIICWHNLHARMPCGSRRVTATSFIFDVRMSTAGASDSLATIMLMCKISKFGAILAIMCAAFFVLHSQLLTRCLLDLPAQCATEAREKVSAAPCKSIPCTVPFHTTHVDSKPMSIHVSNGSNASTTLSAFLLPL